MDNCELDVAAEVGCRGDRVREERRREIVGWRNEVFAFGRAGRGEVNRSGENVVEDGGSDNAASCSTWIAYSMECVQYFRWMISGSALGLTGRYRPDVDCVGCSSSKEVFPCSGEWSRSSASSYSPVVSEPRTS